MEEALFYMAAFTVGLIVGWVSNQQQVHAAEKRASVAEDRLYAAWKDGTNIPGRPDEPQPQQEQAPLHDTLRRIVNEWEDPETREELEHAFRGEMADGFGATAILRHYADGQFDAKPPISMG